MLGTLLLVMIAAAPEPNPAGVVTATLGSVHLLRGPTQFRAGLGSEVRTGDVFEIGAEGGAALLLDGDQVIYLGPDARAVVDGLPGRRTLRLDRGEARAAAAGVGRLRIATPTADARVARGILSVAATPSGTRLWAEGGSAEVTPAVGSGVKLASGAGPVALAEGQQVIVPPGGGPGTPAPGDGRGWSIPIDRMQLASAAALSRVRKVKLAEEAVNATAEELARPSSQLPGAIQPRPSSEPAVPPAPELAAQPQPGQPQGTPDQAADQQTAQSPTEDDAAYQPIVLSQPNTTASTSAISLALGAPTTSAAVGAGGGLFSDAQQDSLNPLFPGNIHLITAESAYAIRGTRLRPGDGFPSTREYFSIGLGPSPTSQVVTTFRTGSDPIPSTLRIPRSDAYLIRFPQNQFGVPDPATNPDRNATPQLGIAGLLGATPTAPQVRGATPLTDPRAVFNDRATFALGEFALQTDARDRPVVSLRRSDQDRQIIKSPDGNDNADRVTPNSRDANFRLQPDPRFFPELPAVNVPVDVATKNPPTVNQLDVVRRAALTTLLADRLNGFARRTGQTRFNVGGQIVDITGYRPTPNPALRAELMRGGPSATRLQDARRPNRR